MANELTVRSMEEITASARIHMQNMVNNALDLGLDLMEAKEACGHGRWLPWLREIGLSSSTAANYMKVAREVSADSKLARLPYSKVLALLSLPAEEREEMAEAAESMSAAEIRRLTEERNKAAEATNIETARANAAEADAKRFYDENAELRTKINNHETTIEQLIDKLDEKEEETQQLLLQCDKEAREEEREKLQAEIDQLKEKLIVTETERVVIEKAPEDYERIKARLAAAERSAKDLIDAAAGAEERAAALEEELETLRNRSEETPNAAKTLRVAVAAFLSDCQLMPAQPDQLRRDRDKIERNVKLIESWCAAMREALGKVIEGEAVIA